jgi:hypothetical protein
MDNRTRRAIYIFSQPFRLESSGENHAAGAYAIDTEEEMIEGLSFPAYRHVATTMIPQHRALWQPIRVYQVDRNELADAIAASGSFENVTQISLSPSKSADSQD